MRVMDFLEATGLVSRRQMTTEMVSKDVVYALHFSHFSITFFNYVRLWYIKSNYFKILFTLLLYASSWALSSSNVGVVLSCLPPLPPRPLPPLPRALLPLPRDWVPLRLLPLGVKL